MMASCMALLPAQDGAIQNLPVWCTYHPGTFHMGPSDEDVNYAYTARNKQVSISGFWMDATEITNNEYRQFTNWVRDSIAAKLMGFIKQAKMVMNTLTGKKPAPSNGAIKQPLKRSMP
jgi:formylglycine-generating enzyme required for sulfatase activity